jgi:ornithine cyclodeaminase
MRYLDDAAVAGLGWRPDETIDVVDWALRAIREGDYRQPLKPYLRFRDPGNRIIAMPGYLGGSFGVAGVKWIASFPGNVDRNLPRAHSVLVLNDASTGKPEAIINTARLSTIRTASVSGAVLRAYLRTRARRAYVVGITGWGPIGQHHARLCRALLGDVPHELRVFEIRESARCQLPAPGPRVEFTSSWQDAYDDADIFVTCTVSREPYVDRRPKAGSLHLNVSLRDYSTRVFPWVKSGIVVDDWNEVCREGTDVERMHRECGLGPDDVATLCDVVEGSFVEEVEPSVPIMFNPMGMAVFDMAIAAYYLHRAESNGAGVLLS